MKNSIPRKPGIYTIENLIDGKLYVGLATDMYIRRSNHWAQLERNKHSNTHLQSAWNKYGESNFIYEVLVECEEEYLASMEHWWCNLLNAHNPEYGYNIRPTHPYGKVRQNEETKRKLSKAHKGIKHTEVTKKKMKGRICTPEAKENMSKSRKGVKLSKQHIEHISESLKGRKNPNCCKAVIKMTKENEYIEEYISITEAAKTIKISGNGITVCCKRNAIGRNRTCGGYKWKYKVNNDI